MYVALSSATSTSYLPKGRRKGKRRMGTAGAGGERVIWGEVTGMGWVLVRCCERDRKGDFFGLGGLGLELGDFPFLWGRLG